MKNDYVITKKRNGEHSAKEVFDIFNSTIEEAKEIFKTKMTTDFHFDEKRQAWLDDQEMEVWGFVNNEETEFHEDNLIYELKLIVI